jgi:WD40 repeat protein
LVAVLALAPLAMAAGYLTHKRNLGRVEATAAEKIAARERQERERMRRFDYATHVQGAYQAWQNTDLKSAMALLDRCRPGPGEEDLREFAWYYVRRLCAGGIVTLRGHEGPVRGVAFSPDGKQMASCGADGTLRTWNCVGGADNVTVARIGNPSYGEGPRGKRSYHGRQAGSLSHGRLLETVEAHEGNANGVAFSRDGKLIATVGDDGYVRIWDAEAHRLRAELSASEGRLLCVVFSPDGHQIAAAGEDKLVYVVDVRGTNFCSTIRGHTDTIYSLAWAADGMRLASGSADQTARVWDMSSPGQLMAVFEPGAAVVSVAFSSDGRMLATGDSFIRLWDLSLGTETRRMNAHHNRVHSIAFSPDAMMLASASADRTVIIWDADGSGHSSRIRDGASHSAELLHKYRGHTHEVLCVAFALRGDRMASGGKDGLIQVWDSTQPQERQQLALGKGNYRVALSPNGATVAVASRRERTSELSLLRLPSCDASMSIALKGIAMNRSLTFSHNGKCLAYALDRGPIFVRDIARGTQRSFSRQPEAPTQCSFSNDAKLLAVASHRRGSARILDAGSGEVIVQLPGQRLVAFSPDDSLVATESAEIDEYFPVVLCDATSGRPVRRLIGHKAEINSAAFSADARLLATGSADGTARLWSVEDGAERLVLRSHREGVVDVAFLLSEKSLATASADGTVRIWSVATGRHLLSLPVATGWIHSMSVSADGRALITVSSNADGTREVALWSAPPEPSAN